MTDITFEDNKPCINEKCKSEFLCPVCRRSYAMGEKIMDKEEAFKIYRVIKMLTRSPYNQGE